MFSFGNMVIEEKESVVEVRLLTSHPGNPVAVFTYREIEILSKRFAAIKKPAKVEPEDDWRDLV